ncbi:YdcF family protein [Lacibacterium aquatile]|uniref:YdcF family protein n=1 Tax=Lacibacterium aquatile TaxID=1168082 RepID=A0ABW5DNJ4_9PROT
MAFIASKLLWWLFSPGNLILFGLIFGWLLSLVGWRRFGRSLCAFSVLLLLAMAVLPMGDWLLRPLENRFPAPANLTRVDGVIVLGGPINGDLSRLRGQPVVNDSAERILAMIELSRRFPDAKVVFSSGTASLDGEGIREADVAAELVAKLGVPDGRILFERDARNTQENAENSRLLVQPKEGEVWLLVTSAHHMPRSVGIFRQIGWNVTAYPVDYGTAPDGEGASYAVLDGMNATHWAIREWLGLLYYRLMGRTAEIFPHP